MFVELLKDVALPHNGTDKKAPTGPPVVGQIGQVVDLTEPQARAFLKRGLAKETEATEATLDTPAPTKTAPLTHDTLKENAEAEGRKKKPATGPAETK